ERVHVAADGRPPRRRVRRAPRIGVLLRDCAAPSASVPAAGRGWTNWHEIVAKDTSRRRRGRGNVGLEGGGVRPHPGGGHGSGAGVFGHGSKGQWMAAPGAAGRFRQGRVAGGRYSRPMPARPRLLVLNQYYWPGVEATAHLLTELCEALATEYDVT